MGTSESGEPADLNLFMMCEALNEEALAALHGGYHIRPCRPDELEIWKAFPFDNPADYERFGGYMTQFFDRVYAPQKELFYEVCLFVCDGEDRPIGTAFMWRVYGEIMTMHWVKVLKGHEGKGIGRALLSHILRPLVPSEYPIYLHTQPESFRAIKLYTDLGFKLLTDPMIGPRKNDLEESLPLLEKWMPKQAFESLQTAVAPAEFLEVLAGVTTNDF